MAAWGQLLRLLGSDCCSSHTRSDLTGKTTDRAPGVSEQIERAHPTRRDDQAAPERAVYALQGIAQNQLPGETEEETQFRLRLRSWLRDHCRSTASAPAAGDVDIDRTDAEVVAAAREFQGALYQAGFAGLGWPQDCGGQGLGHRYQFIFAQEAESYVLLSSLLDVGLGMCGPTVIAHGTDEQKREFVARILTGESVWAQLFSEPDAGSDLAGIRTEARRDGDGWLVNGQKVWTSLGHYADFGLLLARTDPDQPKHAGLTLFILDLQAPGVVIRPLRQMSGDERFSEVFLEDVWISDDHVVGGVNDGWRCATTTLMNERFAVGGSRVAVRAGPYGELLGQAAQRELLHDASVRQRLADIWVRTQIVSMLDARVTTAYLAGRAPGPEGSITKLATTRLMTATSRLGLDLCGPTGTAWDPSSSGSDAWARRLHLGVGMSIAGGTDEIQLSIIGERVLGLPKEPDAQRGLPFRKALDAARGPAPARNEG